jgi:hypothetical protein
VLSIDADERVTPELEAQIQDAMASGRAQAFEIPAPGAVSSWKSWKCPASA